jgi:hypothetical protein
MLAQVAEIHRDPKKRSRPYDAAELHPLREQADSPAVQVVTQEVLKEII